MDLATLVLYDVEDDRARARVADACKDYGLRRLQYSCFSGPLSRNQREELRERLCAIQRQWADRCRRLLPGAKITPVGHDDSPDLGDGDWRAVFKVLIQPLCERDAAAALRADLFLRESEPCPS